MSGQGRLAAVYGWLLLLPAAVLLAAFTHVPAGHFVLLKQGVATPFDIAL